jgi:predicted CoA-substrate-specific enzyme activase
MSLNRKRLPPTSDKYFVGIDAGSISINCALINEKKEFVFEYPYQRHLGKIEQHVDRLIKDLYLKFGEERIESISFTGNHGKKLSERLGMFYEFETISQVVGSIFLRPDAESIISLGGQETALFQISHHGHGWELEFFNTNGPCAAGTGSFIDQQAQRLATAIYTRQIDNSPDIIDDILSDFIALGSKSDKPASVACRCTVFTKSDMIHLQNKGEKLDDIIYGLHLGNARNYMSTIVSNRKLKPPILFIGGLSLNRLQVKAFRQYFPELIIPPHSTTVGALGVALQAFDSSRKIDVVPDRLMVSDTGKDLSFPLGAKLTLDKTVFPEFNEIQRKPFRTCRNAYLGIDIGSTTTKYALIDDAREIIYKCYVPTQGKPIETTQKLLKVLQQETAGEVNIAGVATTGSGRNVVGDFLCADLIVDEITAHAKGAVEIDSSVDTIFEIGGQDSKYIYIANTYPLDFDMNKVCAAGTGSFLHELANKYGINIVEEFQEIALSSNRPVKLAERCTVFMESDLVSYHQKGAEKTDLIAGLCYAIVYNYLNRVVEKRKIGQRIMFLGGPSLNKGVVAAFENVLNRGVIVPQHREVIGAFGAAIGVQDQMRLKENSETTFRGIEAAVADKMDYVEKTCRADGQCHNECKLKIFNFDGRRSIWGGECGRYESVKSKHRKKGNFFELRDNIWQEHMTGVYAELKEEPILELDGRPTVGMMRALYGLQTSVFWGHFFDRLGLRLVLTPPTNQQIARAGIEAMLAETCFPVKVSHGHARQLLDKTRFLFLPTLIDMPTPVPSERGFYCPLVQGNSYMLRAALTIEPSNLLSPVLHLKNDPDTLSQEISDQLRSRLRVSKKAVKSALINALEKQNRFTDQLHGSGREIRNDAVPGEPLVVVTGRPYNLYDERLNLRVGQNLAKIGISALPMDFFDVSSVDLSDFPSMYWGIGAQIIRTAKVIRNRPDYFGIHLTNFGCGADSFIEHFYKHIMGDKPYLILELDEHSAVAGVMTRLEAYRHVIDNTVQKLDASVNSELKATNR